MSEKMKEQSFWEKTKRFLEPMKHHKGITFKMIIYFIVQFSFGIIFLFFVRDVTEAFENLDNQAFQHLLRLYAVIFLAVFILIFSIYKWWIYSFNRYREFIEEKYLPEYVRFDMNYYEKIGTGKSIAIISKGVKTWGGLLDRVIYQSINMILSLLVSFYLLSQIDNTLISVLSILLIFGLALGVFLNNKVLKIRKKRIELDNRWSKSMVKIIMAKMEILQSGKIYNEVEKLHENHEGQIYYNGKMAVFLVPFFLVGSFIVAVLLFFVFHYFGDKYFNGEISLAYIASITGALLMMQTVFHNFLDFLKNFGKEFAEVQNMWDFFDTTPQIQGYEEGNIFQHQNGEIELRNISYGYREDKKIFENFSLKIPGNKITALVGPSGGGKSTLVKLISGYIKVDSGEIVIDNQKLSRTSLKSYYQDVGYLTQEPSVFDGTVRENLMYGVREEQVPTVPHPNPLLGEEREQAADEIKKVASFSSKGEGIQGGGQQIDKIITLANCEFIYELPQGLDTEIGERGVKLSGGQKQRLAIAKIFLKDPKIIILDEPTSALDSLSEQKITEAMHNLFKDRTVIVIAHRLQTVKYADDILVIEDGKLKERGTHTSLTEKNGFYKQMLDLQSGF